MTGSLPLSGFEVVNVAINLPGPAAAARLSELGASVTKVEPPEGDPTEAASKELYDRLAEGHTILRLNLKEPADRGRLSTLLEGSDLLLTSSRPSALARFGLSWSDLESRHPRLVQVAIVGHAAPRQELAGHDLTYVGRHGLLAPPDLPRTLVADLGGAERAVTAAVSLLLARERGGDERYAEVALEDSASFFALPWEYGLTRAGGPLGGALPFYRAYEARGGWVALAALEPRFQERLVAALQISAPTAPAFAAIFAGRTPAEWELWAQEHDVPLAAVQTP